MWSDHCKMADHATMTPSTNNWAEPNIRRPAIANYNSEEEQREQNGSLKMHVSVYRGSRDSEPSQYVSVPSGSPSPEKRFSCVHVQLHSVPNEVMIDSNTDNSKDGAIHRAVPLTCSWPSIADQEIMKTPSIGFSQTGSADYNNEQLIYKRLSSNCDSGYSEPELFFQAQEHIALEAKCVDQISFDLFPGLTSDKETQTELYLLTNYWDVKKFSRFDCSFHLSNISEADSEEEYFREIKDMSLCSDLSKELDYSESKMDLAQMHNQSSKDSFDYIDILQLTPARHNSVINSNTLAHNVSRKYLERLEKQQFYSIPSLNTEKGKW